MKFLRHLPLALVLSVFSTMSGCNETTPASPEQAGPKTFFPIRIGEVVVEMQLAVHPLEMQQGLMHRVSLGENEGMIFLHEEPNRLGFWMRNTLIPLDIGFFDRDGVLREVRAMHPLDENRVTSFSSDIQFAVEMNQGWYRKNGIKPGAKLDFVALRKALTARGVDPRAVGLR